MKNTLIPILAASTFMLASFAHAATSNGYLASNLNHADAQVQQNNTKIQRNSKDLAQYRHDLKTVNWAHNYYKTKNNARLDGDEKKIANNSDSIQKLKKGYQGAEAHIKDNQVSHSQMKQRVNRDEQQIQSNHTQVSSVHQSLQADEANIKSNTMEIKSLKRDFERMADNIDGAYASAAAMNALTAPHNVGNVMISVGVGHHGSADAFAMGASERISDSVTAKLGAAYNLVDSSMTTFIGIGYEF